MRKTMPVYRGAGAPSAGTDAVDTLTFAAGTDGGTFKLAFAGQTTAAISWSSTNNTLVANIDAALGALGAVGGASNVTTAVGTMTAGIGTITVTWVAALGKLNPSALTVADDSLTGTGAEVTVERTTPGVTATLRGKPKGTLYVRQDTGVLHVNTGTSTAPTWTAQT